MDITQFKKTYEHKKVVENKNKVAENPLVTVCIQTYQHVDYIKECLDGILNQKTNFDFEILLRDDASTDGTQEICSAYKRKYPEFINLLLYSENQFQKGVKPFPDNVKRAQGKYIALCEGDDYWTDPLKLQKQVDFLEANPDYGICGHSIMPTDTKPIWIKKFDIKKSLNLSLKDVILKNKLLTVSLVMRKDLVMSFQSNIEAYPPKTEYVGDYPQIIYVAQLSKAFMFKDKMAAYRNDNLTSFNHSNSTERKNKIFRDTNLYIYDAPFYSKQVKKYIEHRINGTQPRDLNYYLTKIKKKIKSF